MADFTIKRNDTAPPIVVVLSDAEGPIDLTNAEAIHIYLRSDTRLVKTAAMDVVDVTAGKARYVWQSGDLSEANEYKMEFEINWEDGTVQTVPNDSYLELLVVEDLGEPGEL